MSIISRKKNCVEIKKIKGKISKTVEGTFSAPINNEKKIFVLESEKKEISSNKLSIKTKAKKIKKIFKNYCKNNLIIYKSIFLIYSLLEILGIILFFQLAKLPSNIFILASFTNHK